MEDDYASDNDGIATSDEELELFPEEQHVEEHRVDDAEQRDEAEGGGTVLRDKQH